MRNNHKRQSTAGARPVLAASARALCLLAALLAAGSCARQQPRAEAAQQETAATVTIMTFNVENLFDTRHDPGKNDLTYLPLAQKQSAAHRAQCEEITVDRWRDQCLNWDWSETVLEKKLRALADAILAGGAPGAGTGPDVLVLQEVENIAVLDRLRRNYLQAAGYLPPVLLEGPDLRGIDVAFLTRLPLHGKPALHPIPFEGFESGRVQDTRGILEATFVLPGGDLLTGFAVHFPAPFHPYAMREQAYRFLNHLLEQLPSGRQAFAAGDFNTTAHEDREQKMLERFVDPRWLVAHREGCYGCPGTHYYAPRDDWSFLDMIIFARATPRGGWRLQKGSARLVNTTAAQQTAQGTPAAFDLPEADGVSDHWPLQVTLTRAVSH